jgi:hypothetical protein
MNYMLSFDFVMTWNSYHSPSEAYQRTKVHMFCSQISQARCDFKYLTDLQLQVYVLVILILGQDTQQMPFPSHQ